MAASENEVERLAESTHDLADVMSRAARRLQGEHGDLEGTLAAITAAATTVIPHAEGCSISYVIGRSTVQPRASTGALPRELDVLQEKLGQGPCLDAVWEHEVVRVDDLSTDDRWPKFARQASERGVRSMVCFRLFVEGDRLGALNMYSRTAHAFDEESQDVGRLFAAHAAIAVAGAEHEANLRTALTSRDVIGQAKGILMERHKLTAAQAFGVLAQVSQELNRKLIDVAREVCDTGAVPGGRRPR
jgi:GAF domain-containing protein